MFFVAIFVWWTFAQTLQIIPEAKPNSNVWNTVEKIGVWWKVRDQYNKAASEYQKTGDLWAQMASWVFTWDTLLDYLVYLVKFASQAGLFIWACFIIYAGYLYATSIFTGDSWAASSGNKAIKNAIIWVILITFSYAIMKAITSAFL